MPLDEERVLARLRREAVRMLAQERGLGLREAKQIVDEIP